MLNIYELIQKAINDIEEKLETHIQIDKIAFHVGMSQSNLYRFFLSIVGYSIKEYIRLRRISEAAMHLKSGKTATEMTYRYDYDSLDAFSRSFRRITGYLPSQYKKQYTDFQFKKINLIERNFMNLQDKALDIQVLKNVSDTEVVYFNYYGKDPEDGAFELFKQWINKEKIDLVKEGLRVFGYNNPNPTDDSGIYGYEVCVTLNETVKKKIGKLPTKILDGGMYALVTVKQEPNKHIGQSIFETWQRFGTWLQTSKFQLSPRQWLEEHHGFDEQLNHIGNVDLYMSIEYKPTHVQEDEVREMKARFALYHTFSGKHAINAGKTYIFEWLKENQIDLLAPSDPIYIFSSYDLEKIGYDDLVYTVYFIVPYKKLDQSWKNLYQKYTEDDQYQVKDTQIFEQYFFTENNYTDDMLVLQLLSVNKL